MSEIDRAALPHGVSADFTFACRGCSSTIEVVDSQRLPHSCVGKPAEYHTGPDGCGRIIGIGCACGLPFAEKVKGVGAALPESFRAVKS